MPRSLEELIAAALTFSPLERIQLASTLQESLRSKVGKDQDFDLKFALRSELIEIARERLSHP